MLNLRFSFQTYFKGTVSGISCDPPCKEGNVGFTIEPFKPLIDYRGQRNPCLYL